MALWTDEIKEFTQTFFGAIWAVLWLTGNECQQRADPWSAEQLRRGQPTITTEKKGRSPWEGDIHTPGSTPDPHKDTVCEAGAGSILPDQHIKIICVMLRFVLRASNIGKLYVASHNSLPAFSQVLRSIELPSILYGTGIYWLTPLRNIPYD